MITVSSCGVKLQEVLSGLERERLKHWRYTYTFVAFLNYHLLLYYFFAFHLGCNHLWCNFFFFFFLFFLSSFLSTWGVIFISALNKESMCLYRPFIFVTDGVPYCTVELTRHCCDQCNNDIIMAYGSTPYVGMVPKKNGGHIKSAQITRSKCRCKISQRLP